MGFQLPTSTGCRISEPSTAWVVKIGVVETPKVLEIVGDQSESLELRPLKRMQESSG